MKPFALGLGLSLILAALLAAACGPTATSPTAAPGPAATPAGVATAPKNATLVVGLPFISQPPDPVRGGFQPVQTGVAETLFKLGRDLKPEPWLATGARQLDDKTWEIALRQGVKFHDGAVMDAAAVKASLARRLLAEAGWVDADGDGVLDKNGQPLALKLLTYKQRPELPPWLRPFKGR
ncbi:MAG: hypothetical protein FJ316_01085 [SAR202 cluster bacterium]|nr:hypothetical protein [SAR202 cluster bacterium]